MEQKWEVWTNVKLYQLYKREIVVEYIRWTRIELEGYVWRAEIEVDLVQVYDKERWKQIISMRNALKKKITIKKENRRTLTRGKRTRLVAEFVIKSIAKLPSKKHFADNALECVAEYCSRFWFFQNTSHVIVYIVHVFVQAG